MQSYFVRVRFETVHHSGIDGSVLRDMVEGGPWAFNQDTGTTCSISRVVQCETEEDVTQSVQDELFSKFNVDPEVFNYRVCQTCNDWFYGAQLSIIEGTEEVDPVTAWHIDSGVITDYERLYDTDTHTRFDAFDESSVWYRDDSMDEYDY